MNTGHNSKHPASAGTLGEKGCCRTGFNTLDNWGHKTPTQSKRKRTGKKRLKGHGPEHVYNTLGYTCLSYLVLGFVYLINRTRSLQDKSQERTANPSATTMLAVAQWQMSCLWKDLNARKQHVENISQMCVKNSWGEAHYHATCQRDYNWEDDRHQETIKDTKTIEE